MGCVRSTVSGSIGRAEGGFLMSPKIIHLFVPGRLCLFGEHSDWAGMYRTVNADIAKGAAIVSGTEQGIYALAEKADRLSCVAPVRFRRMSTGNVR